MDPKKNKPKTGSQPMNVDPTTAARMSNLPAGGSRNIRIRKLSDEEKAQSRQSKIKGGLENLTGRSFGGGEPTAGGDVDPKTGNLLPKDPRRPKKNRNVGGPAGPGDIDPETGDLIGEGAPEPSSGNPTGNPYKFRGIADLKKKLADINARGKEQERLKGLRNDPLRSLNLPAQGTKSRMIQPEDKNESVLHERNMTAAERQQAANQRVADYRERKAAEAEAKKRRIMTTPGGGLSKETAAGNQAVYDRIDAADANLKRLEAGRKTMPERMADLKAERDALEKQIAKDMDRADRAAGMTTPQTSGVGGYSDPTTRRKSTPMDAPITSPSNPLNKPLPPKPAVPLADRAREVGLDVPASMQKPSTPAPAKPSAPAPAPTIATVAQPKFNYNPTARAMGFGGGSSRRGLGLGGSRSGGELRATSARRNILASVQRGVENYLQEAVKKAGHPESFELGLDAETTDNPEYQKILRQKRVERAKQMLNPKLARTMGDDVSQDDIEAADRAARRRKRVDEAMGNEDSEYQKILQSMRANDPVLRMLRGAKPAGDGMVSVKPIGLSKAEDKKLERAYLRKFNPRNVGKDAY